MGSRTNGLSYQFSKKRKESRTAYGVVLNKYDRHVRINNKPDILIWPLLTI